MIWSWRHLENPGAWIWVGFDQKLLDQAKENQVRHAWNKKKAELQEFKKCKK